MADLTGSSADIVADLIGSLADILANLTDGEWDTDAVVEQEGVEDGITDAVVEQEDVEDGVTDAVTALEREVVTTGTVVGILVADKIPWLACRALVSSHARGISGKSLGGCIYLKALITTGTTGSDTTSTRWLHSC